MEKLGINTGVVKPVIMAIEPSKKENVKAILQHYCNKKALGNIDFDLVAEKLISVGIERGGKYSNAQIEQIVYHSAKTGKNGISQQDLLDCIVEGNPDPNLYYPPPIPTIDREKQEIFDKAYKQFMR